MILEGISSKDYMRRALEVAIHVGLLSLLAAACLLILRPFIPLIAWGIIIAIAAYPGYRRVQNLVGGSSRLAAVAVTVFLFVVLLVPVVLLTGSLVEGIQSLAAHLKDGTHLIPPPPPRIETWPVIGPRLKDAWELASKNLAVALQTFAPQIKVIIPQLFLASAGVGLAVLQWILSVIVAGVLLANSAICGRTARSLANRLFGDKGPEFEELAGATVRSVTNGIIGVALIQSIFAAVVLFAAVLQLGGLVLIPAVIYMFAIASTTKAVIFLVWCVMVGLMDNVLKPLLLGRGVAVPTAVVFLGAIGGFMAMGIIGLFVGAIVLSVGYKLFLAWLEGTVEIAPQT
ncbi:MAG: AI-2E family transporter [Acidobacteria bacterium]|nr:MAG: AI-2E family transporter [Acidobacteriota bacterium]